MAVSAPMELTLPGSSTERHPPGCRDAGNEGRLGDLMYVGSYGYSWSSTASGTNGIYLYFCAAWIDSSFAYPRAYGFQLRCLSE